MLKNKKKNAKKQHWLKDETIFSCAKQSKQSLLQDFNLKFFGDASNRKTRISKYGLNTTKISKFNHILYFLKETIEPFNILLFVMIFIDLGIYFFKAPEHGQTSNVDNLVSAIISFILLSLNMFVAQFLGYKSYKVSKELYDVINNRYNVVNYQIDDLSKVDIPHLQSKVFSIARNSLTIGDVVLLQKGDIVPSDMRVLWASNLSVNDNHIRGSKVKVFKTAEYMPAKYIYDLQNILLSQSQIISGTALAMVTGVGENNSSFKLLSQETLENQSFYKKGLKRLMIGIMLSILVVFPVACVAHILWNPNSSLLESALFAISIIISLTPEALPALVAFNLLYGASQIKNKKVIIKNFDSIQDMGAVNLLITNKSGPVVKQRFILYNTINYNEKKSNYVYNLAFMNAYFQNSLNYKYEKVILDHEKNPESIVKYWELVSTKEIDLYRKIGTIIVKNKLTGKALQITKGTFKNVHNITKFVNDNGTIVPFTPEMKAKLYEYVNNQIDKGFKSILVLTKEIKNINDPIVEDNLVFEGIMLFQNLVQEDVKESLTSLLKYNIDFKMFSSDDEMTTMWAAKEAGVPNINFSKTLEMGYQNDKKEIIEEVNVFANLSPRQKALLINEYKKQGNVVAYLANGRNDTVAVKRADVGIVPETATPISKIFADIIVKETKISNIDEAFVIGRKTFINSIKYIQLTFAINLGLLLSLFVTNLLFDFVPLNSNELLLQSLLIDILNFAFIYDVVDKQTLKNPVKWNLKRIAIFSLWNCLLPMFVSISNIAIVAYGFGWKDEVNAKEKIQTVYFIESFLTRLLLLFIYRTEKLSLIKSRPSAKYALIVLMVALAMIALTYTPWIDTTFDMSTPDSWWWGMLAGIIFVTWALGESIKKLYLYIFKEWF
ncbi:HAD-IC family P-type ATPase [Spiroplasma endosymbiont of Crioceris asparagi]|uniref:HAD-IC family P-type ATPase n=1 Tax=Spiroplasma endosymbiont of Crioceris asparagi TaxID=3066286 RepID=UPI0030CCB22F